MTPETSPPSATPRPVHVASVPLGDGHQLKVTAETRKGRSVADLRLFSRVRNPHTGVRALTATRRSFTVDAAALPALVVALNAALAALTVVPGGVV